MSSALQTAVVRYYPDGTGEFADVCDTHARQAGLERSDALGESLRPCVTCTHQSDRQMAATLNPHQAAVDAIVAVANAFPAGCSDDYYDGWKAALVAALAAVREVQP